MSLWPASGAWNLSYADDVFGPLFGGGSVKQALIETLTMWLPTYVAEINRQLGSNVLYVPKDYLYQPDERAVAPQTSQATVFVPRTIGTPERRSDGTRTIWQAQTEVYFAGTQDWNLSEAVAWAYEAAVRASIAQHRSLGGFAESTMWVGSQLGKRERVSTIWRVSVQANFHVVVANAMSPDGGPAVPAITTPVAVPEVTDTEITLSQL